MSNINNQNYIRTALYEFGTKTIKTESGIEYCVEYITEDKKQTRLLWFKQSGEYILLNANQKLQKKLKRNSSHSGIVPDIILILYSIIQGKGGKHAKSYTKQTHIVHIPKRNRNKNTNALLMQKMLAR